MKEGSSQHQCPPRVRYRVQVGSSADSKRTTATQDLVDAGCKLADASDTL